MRKLHFAAATALLLATTSAQAGNAISFEIDGQRVRIEAPRNCDALSCIRISAPGFKGNLGNINLKGLGSKDDDIASDPPPAATTAAPAQTTTAPPAPLAAAPVAPAAVAPAAPTTTDVASAPAPVTNDITPAPAPVPAPVAVAPAPAPAVAAPAAVAAAPAIAANSPIGVWATEENKGNVRIEQCGTNLCGFAVKTNARILINMKPSESKWVGRIHDPDSGRNYDSTIAMRGPNALRVQGCAFGGMFCGGQTWKRVS